MTFNTYLFHRSKVGSAVLVDVIWLIAQYFTRKVVEQVRKGAGNRKLL